MLTYRITCKLSTDEELEFTVTAKSLNQARKFGLNTAMSMMSTKGLHGKIVSIDVSEYYDVD